MSRMQKQHPGIGNPTSTCHPAGVGATVAAQRDPVDDAGDDSFPCSDPPSWTLGLRNGPRATNPGLAPGTLLPSITLPSVPDGKPVTLRGGRGPRVVVMAHAAGCAACERYIGQLAASAGDLAEWDGSVMVVLPGLGAGALRESASPSLRILADPEQKIAPHLGLRGTAVLVADEWGEIYFAADSGAEHELPPPEEIVEWVRFIAIQCPECEQPEGEWRTI